jgi:transposase-like protein
MERIKTMQRKKHSAEFKAKIALEAAKGLKTVNKIGEVKPSRACPRNS